jgi:hypothetical protein
MNWIVMVPLIAITFACGAIPALYDSDGKT